MLQLPLFAPGGALLSADGCLPLTLGLGVVHFALTLTLGVLEEVYQESGLLGQVSESWTGAPCLHSEFCQGEFEVVLYCLRLS